MMSDVSALLRTLAERHVLPRYNNLRSSEVEEKAPDDLVTIVDRAVEEALADALSRLLPAARFVGEERCSIRPELLETVGSGLVWVVDPIDGTGNFAAGRPPFAMMVALLRDGTTLASWIYDPLNDRMMTAELGRGARCNGQPVSTGGTTAGLRGIVSRFAMPAERAGAVAALERDATAILPTTRCAGHEYPLVAAGRCDFALYWRTLIWDHVAGALLLTEAGGVVERLDGTPYLPGSTGAGLLLARNRQVADAVRAVLNGDSAR